MNHWVDDENRERLGTKKKNMEAVGKEK